MTLVTSPAMERLLTEVSRANAILLEALVPIVDGGRHNRVQEIEETLSRVLHWDPVLGYALRTFLVDPIP